MKLIELAKVLNYSKEIHVRNWEKYNIFDGETDDYVFKNCVDLYVKCVTDGMIKWTVSSVTALYDCLVINCNM